MAVATEIPRHRHADRPTTPAAALTALGIVYGDLGTSPLYTLQTVTQTLGGGQMTAEGALGILSLIVWALIITISIKYCVFVMRADNHGEGGILALMSLLSSRRRSGIRPMVLLGLFGAALIYGDGIITPAISVLSALEGLNVATEIFKPYVMPLAVVILLCLFGIQARGTARIGKLFGPVMLLWFAVMALLGLGGILHYPRVLLALNPFHAAFFLLHHGWTGFVLLGGVFLAITGGEALYADMGHIGRNPIRTSWYGIVLPALLLNYAGETALLITHPALQGNPFFMLAPAWAIYPLVVLATAATIIASQAIITGSFSLTRQAMQLGWMPGLLIRQTSAEEYGQIYVPFVNWTMMIFTLALTVGFGSSSRLAGAYGTAVSTTMLLTTALLYTVMRERWHWSLPLALLTSGTFLIVDLVFFSANLLKIDQGGWIPLSFGLVLFVIMTTWHRGMDALQHTPAMTNESAKDFFKELTAKKVPRVAGTAVFLSRATEAVPSPMVQYVDQTGALHKTVIALTVKFEDIPRVPATKRLDLEHIQDGFWHMTVRYGFIEVPDLPASLRGAKLLGCPVEIDSAVYFGAHADVVRGKRKNKRIARWRLPLFIFLFRNAMHAVELFRLPREKFLEIGRRIEI